jgi:hypothetical protein
VGVQRYPDPTGAPGQFGEVRGFQRGAEVMRREIRERPVQGLGGGQALDSQQSGQQRLLEQADVVGPATAPPGEREPHETEHEGGQPPLAAVQEALQAQAGRVSEQARQGGGIRRLHGRDGDRYTAHEDRAPACGFSTPQDARSFSLRQAEL